LDVGGEGRLAERGHGWVRGVGEGAFEGFEVGDFEGADGRVVFGKGVNIYTLSWV
jgi:hypothetical protein